MKIIDTIKEQATKIILSGLFAILGFLIGSMYHDLSPTFLQTILEAISKPLLLKLLIAAIIIIVLLSVLSLYLYLKNRKKFTSKCGILWDKDKKPYCPACQTLLSEYHQQSMPNKSTRYKFRCVKCNSIIELRDERGQSIDIETARKNMGDKKAI